MTMMMIIIMCNEIYGSIRITSLIWLLSYLAMNALDY